MVRVIAGKVYGAGGIGHKPNFVSLKAEPAPIATPLSKLSTDQKELICKVLGVDACDDNALERFKALPDHDREFKIANAISSNWSAPDFLERITRFRIAAARINSMFELKPAHPTDKYFAASNPDNLSESQKLIIQRVTGESEITSTVIDTFSRTIDNVPIDERAHYWKNHVLSLVTAGDLVNKLRFEENPTFNEQEKKLICAALGKEWGVISQADLARLAKDVTAKRTRDGDKFNSAISNIYSKVAADGLVKTPDELWKMGQLAQEYHTLLDFLGCISIPLRLSQGYLDTQATHVASVCSIGQQHVAESGVYEDARVSLVVMTNDDRRLSIDAVFDGMGGYSGGDTASLIGANSVRFAALTGLITSPQEARRAVILADIGIMFAVITSQAGRGPSDMFYLRGGEMGTTVAISYVDGHDFYGVHSGDSQYSVCRNGQVIFKSIEHSMLFTYASNFYPGGLDAYNQATYEEKIRFFESDDARDAFKTMELKAHEITSALGCFGGNRIEINNGIPGPVKLEGGDGLVTNTDGTETVTDAEVAVFVAGGLPAVAAKQIHDLAVDRVDQKPDDKTVVVRKVY